MPSKSLAKSRLWHPNLSTEPPAKRKAGMASRIPTYSICNLNGIDRCVTEFTVAGLRAFVDSHADLVFPHRHHFFQLVLFTEGGGEIYFIPKWTGK